jgi:N-acetyl-1-D-myo-inositol-2-amino-2-deoxy-alpha-D-glucopyranoside deacetylase
MTPDLLATFGVAPVFLHAHPDDESISTGGTIAALVREGARVSILTGTRGERGEVVPGELAALEGTPRLGPHRVGELANALRELGGPEHVFLGTPPARAAGAASREYSDSGMRWGSNGFAEAADDASPASLSLEPLADVVADVLAALTDPGSRAAPPTSIVSYDALGGYGHPDHVRMHAAGVEAARMLGLPFFAIVEPRVDEGDRRPDSRGSAEEQAVVVVDLAARSEHGHPGAAADLVEAKARAMAAHRSQLAVVPGEHRGAGRDFVLSGGQRHPIATVERFRPLT